MYLRSAKQYNLKLKELTKGWPAIESWKIVQFSKLKNGDYAMYLVFNDDNVETAFYRQIHIQYSNTIGLKCSIDDLIGKEGTFSKYEVWDNYVWELQSEDVKVLIHPTEKAYPIISNFLDTLKLSNGKYSKRPADNVSFKDKVRRYCSNFAHNDTKGVIYSADSTTRLVPRDFIEIIYFITKGVLRREGLPVDYSLKFSKESGLLIVDTFLSKRGEESPSIRYIFEDNATFMNIGIIGTPTETLNAVAMRFMEDNYHKEVPDDYIEKGGVSIGLIYRI